MAYLPSYATDEEKPGQAPMPTTSAGGAPSSGPPGAPIGAMPIQPQTAAQPQAHYPLITDYLRENAGAGSGMARDLSSRVGADVQQAATEGQKARDDWQKQNQDAIGQWKDTIAQTQAQNRSAYDQWRNGVRQTVQNYMASPKRNALSDRAMLGQDVWAAAPMAADIASAPTVSAYNAPAGVEASAGNARSEIGALGSDYGREALLSGVYGAGRPYGAGMQGLDAALVGRANPQADLMSKYGDVIAALSAAQSAPDLSGIDTSTYGDKTDRPDRLNFRDQVQYTDWAKGNQDAAAAQRAAEEEQRRRQTEQASGMTDSGG